MSKKYGFELLALQCASSVEDQVNCMGLGSQVSPSARDTPIEKLLFLGLYCQTKFGEMEWPWQIISDAKPDNIEKYKTSAGFHHRLIIRKQVQLPNWRIDFLIEAWADWAREREPRPAGWRQLIVECDGHDFHERTKDQAARDRSRDREALLSGVEVFRFTGSELWRDPWGCAGQVIE